MNTGIEAALRAAGIGDLPPAITNNYKKHWIRAIVKVQRSNGYIGYCIAINDGSGRPKIVRDFCPEGLILSVLSIHPYEESAYNIIPRFANDASVIRYLCKSDFNRPEIEQLLSKENKTPEQIKADRDVVKGYIVQVATKQARLLEETKKLGRDALAIADPKLKEKNIKTKKYGRTITSKTK